MGHYHTNLRDIEFNLFEMPDTSNIFGQAPYDDLDKETVVSILDEVARLAEGPIADSYFLGDTDKPHYDPKTFSATLSPEIKKAYTTLMEAEWFRLDLPESLGGAAAPPSLRWAVAEMILGANPAIYLYYAAPLFANILNEIGNDDQKRLAQIMVDNLWGATMVLTEPDAGSDVGAGRTTARLQPDGSWHIDGVKRFITSADHDLADNIVHFVLARPTGIDGLGGPGTKGLSLFIVPKYHYDHETGEIGERNGAYVTNLENKMGLNASTTCEIVFGQNGTPAVGWLVGDRHTGINDMFRVIEWARMMVGTKSMAQLSAAYFTALDFAKTRVQGADLAKASDKTAPRVTIINHPDVRRMLLTQKAYAEGLRALVMYGSLWQTRAERVQAGQLDPDGHNADTLHRIVDLLLPVIKGAGSERAGEALVLSMQTLGGSGYLKDYAVELEIRDQAIDRLYEGVTHQQALDLFVRKIVKDNFASLMLLSGIMNTSMQEGPDELAPLRKAVLDSAANVQHMAETITGWMMASLVTPEDIYKMGENVNLFLMAFGDLIIGWLLTRQAHIAMAALNNPDCTQSDRDFYLGKIETARFFTRTVLPRIASDDVILSSGDFSTIMQLPEEAF